jgi:hypothetical protein
MGEEARRRCALQVEEADRGEACCWGSEEVRGGVICWERRQVAADRRKGTTQERRLRW